MAKGLRSSVKKSNRSKLRRKVFAPVEDARLERLHAKLLEAVHQPKASDVAKENDMDVEESTDASKEKDMSEEMDIDGNPTSSSSTSKKNSTSYKSKSKPRRQKPRNTITFPKSKGKGALKPFSNSKVHKRI